MSDDDKRLTELRLQIREIEKDIRCLKAEREAVCHSAEKGPLEIQNGVEILNTAIFAAAERLSGLKTASTEILKAQFDRKVSSASRGFVDSLLAGNPPQNSLSEGSSMVPERFRNRPVAVLQDTAGPQLPQRRIEDQTVFNLIHAPRSQSKKEDLSTHMDSNGHNDSDLQPIAKQKASNGITFRPPVALSVVDDGNFVHYKKRILEMARDQGADGEMMMIANVLDLEAFEKLNPDEELPLSLFRKFVLDCTLTHQSDPDIFARQSCLRNGRLQSDHGCLHLPGFLITRLYTYQLTGLHWLWELHSMKTGGILGDEMGLGKTVQICAFITALCFTQAFQQNNERLANPPNAKTRDFETTDLDLGVGPRILIVVPGTVLHMWCTELAKWCPLLFVGILHDSGSFFRLCNNNGSNTATRNGKGLVDYIQRNGNVLLTTYGMLRRQQALLAAPAVWDYLILDEGHKIKNPDAEVTLAAKRIHARHRIILSGTPVQNNLKELWSLFDFVSPGKLGTLPVFLTEFAQPIQEGGYANATPLKVHTAYSCALVLKNLISPFILRRMKKELLQLQNNDANHRDHHGDGAAGKQSSGRELQLPNKKEHILFCRLTKLQRAMYLNYITSPEVRKIVGGQVNVLVGIDTLRKICNHPQLALALKDDPGPITRCLRVREKGLLPSHVQASVELLDNPELSGKMLVLGRLLAHWKRRDDRVLVFCQTRQMLTILERFVQRQSYSYLRMDGSVPTVKRAALINAFNTDDSIFVFLLTTKVGGLGVSLVGANCLVIFDPDWNPSTDIQARERAWRLGQQRDVTIYRLLTAGSIEEKIYNRQIFKQYLTARVLTDPSQRRFLSTSDLYELFTLAPDTHMGSHPEARIIHPQQQQQQQQQSNDSIMSNEGPVASDADSFIGRGEIDDLVRQEEVAQNTETTNTSSSCSSSTPLGSKDVAECDDGYILEVLFKDTRVLHSVIDHEKVVEAPVMDYLFIEQQARRLAQQAAANLKRSSEAAKYIRSASHAPVKRPSPSARFGQVSTARPKPNPAIAGGPHNNTLSQVPVSPLDQIAADLHALLKAAPASGLSSQEILDALKPSLERDQMHAFRVLLRKIAVFTRDTSSQPSNASQNSASLGVWRLKPDAP